jgi:hypothetical protein
MMETVQESITRYAHIRLFPASQGGRWGPSLGGPTK